MTRRLNFDPLARPYRWLEYATFGGSLERCRFYFLPELTDARRALILGDGDGRFTARLLAANPELSADIVDLSPAMLGLLEKRLAAEARQRIAIHQADARQLRIPDGAYDLVVTHFFLDCLTTGEVTALVNLVVPGLAPEAKWLVSEFSQPRGLLAAWLGKAVISMLYQAFGWLAGLPVRQLPDYAGALRQAGFVLSADKSWIGGLLQSQLWYCPAHEKRQPVC